MLVSLAYVLTQFMDEMQHFVCWTCSAVYFKQMSNTQGHSCVFNQKDTILVLKSLFQWFFLVLIKLYLNGSIHILESLQ